MNTRPDELFGRMYIEHIGYRDWPEAYLCRNNDLELIIVTSIGPRILSLRSNNGENLLYEDYTNFRVNDWHLYGGHRFTTAPEGDVSYAPDNERCEVDVAIDRLIVRSSILGLGLQKTLEIAPNRNDNAFEIRHYLTNYGTSSWRGAAWAITCVPPIGQIFLPWFASTDIRSSQPRYWTGFDNDYADSEHAQWKTNAKAFQIDPSGVKGKMGLFSERAQIVHLRGGIAFIIQSTDEQQPGSYPDDNCNVEVFTCRDYLELETLGPATLLRPGQSLCHVQSWQVCESQEAWRSALAESEW